MGKFSQFTGEVELEVMHGGKPFKFKVKPTNRQVNKIMAQDKKKRRTEEGIGEVDNIFIEMITTANEPEKGESEEQFKAGVENFVMQHKVDIQTEFAIAMGWTTRERLDKALAAEEAKLNADESGGKD